MTEQHLINEAGPQGDAPTMVLYLGVGGVLQPSESTYNWVHGRDPFQDGHQPYECAPLLDELLAGWPYLHIVLTSVRPWAYGLPAVLEALGPGLAKRVLGHTFDDLTTKARFGKSRRHLSDLDYWRMGKASIVQKHLEWLRPTAWVAVDDETFGWTDEELVCHVVLTPPLMGLLDAEAQAKLAGLLTHQFGPSTEPLAMERRPGPTRLHFAFALARRFAAAAVSYALERVAPRPRVLVLGLDGTLFTTVEGTLIARPHLFSFLEACAEMFERIVVFPEDHNQFHATAEQLVDRGEAPEWLPEVDRIGWDLRTKDLEQAGVFDFQEALMVDDKAEYVRADQQDQWVSLSTFTGTPKDWELVRVTNSFSWRCSWGPGRRVMKVCKYPRCGTVHEAASASALIGVDEKLRHRRTHCRLCSLPSEHFTPLPGEPDLGPNDMGNPMVVVPWMGGAL